MLRTMTVGLLLVAAISLSACGGRDHLRHDDGGRYEHGEHGGDHEGDRH